MRYLAKPNGILLKDHNNHVNTEGIKILSVLNVLKNKFELLSGIDLVFLLKKAIDWHDMGKTKPQWQNACLKDYELKAKGITGYNLRNAEYRHELASTLMMEVSGINDTVLLSAVAAHHGKLSRSENNQKRWVNDGSSISGECGPFNKYVNYKHYISDKLKSWHPETHKINGRGINFNQLETKFSGDIKNIFLHLTVRILLQLADKRASMKETRNIVKDDVSVYPSRSFFIELKKLQIELPWEYRSIQTELHNACLSGKTTGLTILRAVTGGGKSYCAAIWLKYLLNNNLIDKAIIAMPTKFTTNALLKNIKTFMGDADKHYSSSRFDIENYENILSGFGGQDAKDNLNEYLRLQRLLMNPATITTIDQILATLTLADEDKKTAFISLTSSGLVIDEADFYDDYIQENIFKLLNIASLLKIPILIMSASIPDSLIEEYKKAYIGSNYIIDQFDTNDGIKNTPKVKVLGKTSEINFKYWNGDSHLIIYANTVDRAYMYKKEIEKYLMEINKKAKVIVYHSRFLQDDKRKKENDILDLLGEDNQDYHNGVGVVILTQIGEMSINISAPLMYSDVCPIDRLTQRIGRLERFSNKCGQLVIIEPISDTGDIYPAPYGTYVRKKKGWVANEAYTFTLANIMPGIYTYGELLNECNKCYPVYKPKNGPKANAEMIDGFMNNHWLFNPDNKVDEESNTLNWKIRNIEPQTSIFILDNLNKMYKENTDAIISFDTFLNIKNECSISISQYKADKLERNGVIHKVPLTIGTIYENNIIDVWCSDNYNSEDGLNCDTTKTINNII